MEATRSSTGKENAGGMLRRNLSPVDGVGLSLSAIGPAMAISVSVALAAQSSGRAAPLCFLTATIMIILVGLCYGTMAGRIAQAGSIYAYIGATLNPGLGFLAGWTVILGYWTFATASAAVAGESFNSVLRSFGIQIPWLWIALGVVVTLLCVMIAGRSMRLATCLMLLIQALALLPALFLSVTILHRVETWSLLPFVPDPSVGVSGIGYGVVGAILSFAGFEGASTLGEEISNPRRSIPVAFIVAILIAGSFFVLNSYTQVLGYGLNHTAELVAAQAPLHHLAEKFVSPRFAVVLDFSLGLSAFGCCLASLCTSSRVLFALGRAGLSSELGKANPQHGTPSVALWVMGIPCLLAVWLWGGRLGATTYFGYVGTIGALSVILVYLSVTVGVLTLGRRLGRRAYVVLGTGGAALLAWTFYASLLPVPDYPLNFFPYIVMLWMEAGAVVLFAKPELAEVDFSGALLPEENPGD